LEKENFPSRNVPDTSVFFWLSCRFYRFLFVKSVKEIEETAKNNPCSIVQINELGKKKRFFWQMIDSKAKK